MSERADRNRLDEEASPYLRQHADNPVHWQPWDEAALAEARERDVPVFLSVGYSACHWCHVMEEESFENDAIAEILNENFVPIKVDREERPDLDSLYMSVCQMVTGRGGWPLSAWLTPDGRPFYVGTYFPPEPRRGSPGFEQLLRDIANSWREDREEIEERADQWTAAVEDDVSPGAGATGEAPGAEILDDATRAVVRSADREHGGFGRSGPKFPKPGRVDLLLRAASVRGDDEALSVAVETLDAMATGGLYDHAGGGFHRYATDREWTVPHFEKMLYDNAELPRVYLDAYRLTGASRFALVATETLAFLDRELSHPDGGFFSTLDARSDPGGRDAPTEGAFYVWTPAEVDRAVDDDLTATLARERFGVTEGGNFEDGTTVLTVAASRADLAARHDIAAEEVAERLERARVALFDAREERPRPRRDEKVLAGWNGLAISAFAHGARTLDPALADRATAALAFARDHLWDEDERLLARRYADGDVKGRGYLEDYAFLGRAALDCYQATGEVEPLAFALELARVVRERFWDAEAGTLYFTDADAEGLLTRPQEVRDASTPSSLGVAVDLLLALSSFAPDEGFDEIADAALATHGDRVRGSPTEYPSLVLAADRATRGGIEVTVAADAVPDAWRDRLAATYLPSSVVARRPPTDDGLAPWLDALGVDEAPPAWRGREAREGRPTAYACRGRTCSPPTTDLDEALAWLVED
ncbi:MAG: thioredoxin domain-containing protein [Haloferacaceae archaeon]